MQFGSTNGQMTNPYQLIFIYTLTASDKTNGCKIKISSTSSCGADGGCAASVTNINSSIRLGAN